MNLLDDSLSVDRARVGEITPELTQRMVALARYACSARVDGILYTCSAFGTAIEAAAKAVDVPVLKPNEAMFEAAIAQGRDIAMIITFAPAQATMEAEFAEEAARLGSPARLTTVLVAPAMAALRAGDAATHHRLVAEAAAELRGFDTLVLGHFSTSGAAPAVRAAVSIPVLTSPATAVAKLKRLLST